MTLNIEEKWWLLVRNSEVADGKALRIIPVQDCTKYKAPMGQSRRVWLQRLNPYPPSDKWHKYLTPPALNVPQLKDVFAYFNLPLRHIHSHTHTQISL